MSRLLEGALRALGPAPSDRELELVAAGIRKSGDREALAMVEASLDEGFTELVELAERTGASGFTALDLAVEVCNPGALSRARKQPPVTEEDGAP